jgi:hypothetical protein
MASYMLIGGPSHGTIAEATGRRPLKRPDIAASVMAAFYGRLPLEDCPAPMVIYEPWSLADRLGAEYAGFKIMVAEGTDDAEVVRLFGQIVRAADERRPRSQRTPRQAEGLRKMLADIDRYAALEQLALVPSYQGIEVRHLSL